jgi:hypothetical protein
VGAQWTYFADPLADIIAVQMLEHSEEAEGNGSLDEGHA